MTTWAIVPLVKHPSVTITLDPEARVIGYVSRISCDRLVSAAAGSAVTLAILWRGLVSAATAVVILSA